MDFVISKLVENAQQLFTGNADWTSAIPGGMWHVRGPDKKVEGAGGRTPTARPYATIEAVAVGNPQYQSDYSGLRRYQLLVTIYGDDSTANTGAAATTLANFDLQWRNLATGLPAVVLHCLPGSELLTLDPETHEGADVVIAARGWTLLLHMRG